MIVWMYWRLPFHFTSFGLWTISTNTLSHTATPNNMIMSQWLTWQVSCQGIIERKVCCCASGLTSHCGSLQYLHCWNLCMNPETSMPWKEPTFTTSLLIPALKLALGKSALWLCNMLLHQPQLAALTCSICLQFPLASCLMYRGD